MCTAVRIIFYLLHVSNADLVVLCFWRSGSDSCLKLASMPRVLKYVKLDGLRLETFASREPAKKQIPIITHFSSTEQRTV